MKKSYRLSEVCRLLDLQPYVLRYWITEFPRLGESGGATGQGSFSAREVALLRRIKALLYEEGYTIAGARKKLESDPATAEGGGGEAALLDEEAETLADGESNATALDSADGERIESLRQGIAEALAEARAILSLLDSSK